VISDFRREVEDNYALLGHYAASTGNFLPTFRDTGPEMPAGNYSEINNSQCFCNGFCSRANSPQNKQNEAHEAPVAVLQILI
jgi:hypothetical protein